MIRPKVDPLLLYKSLKIKESFYTDEEKKDSNSDEESKHETGSLEKVKCSLKRAKRGSQPFKSIARDQALRISSYYFPKDQENWNNGAQRYNPN